MQIIYICAGLLLVCVIILFVILMRSKFQNTTLRKDLQTLLTHNETLTHNEQILQAKIRESSEQYTKLLQENARLQAYMDSNATLLQTLEQTYAQNLATLKKEFAQSLQIQSQGMLQQNKLYLMEDSKKILESLFATVRESMRE